VSRSPDPAPTPRDWVGDRPFPWPPTLDATDGEDVVACFSVMQASVGRTRNDKPFLRLQLADCYGTLDARLWDNADALMDVVRPGAYIGVRGCVETYQDQRQLRIEAVSPLRVELDDLVLFLPRSARPADVMDAELAAVINSVADPAFHQLLAVMLGAATDTGQAFRLAPAAKQNHHAYLGGLLEHTLSVVGLCDLLAEHYGAAVDRDLLVTAALLHDIGKVREIGARAGFPYTDEGKLLGHIIIGMQMVADAARHVPQLDAGRLLLLQHLVASHQGRYEWQSPREPRTIEAIILHYADDLDAKLAQAGALLDAVTGGWTAYDRSFARDFLKHRAAVAPPAPLGASPAPDPHEPPALKRERAARPAPTPAAGGPAAMDAPGGVGGQAAVSGPAAVDGPAGMDGPAAAEADGSPDPLGTLDLFGNGEPA
jgi:3'-5' exoribonuclease